MLQLSELLLNQIKEHGESHYPEEGAGLILGGVHEEVRSVEQLLPLANQFEASSRHNRYMIEPEEMINAEMKAEELGLDIIGVFHSHPNHPAIPSEFDRERALPWFSYIITRVDSTGASESRSWRLSDDRQFLEEKLQIAPREDL
jgi:proteasome lid subunit RPN8/RPN11